MIGAEKAQKLFNRPKNLQEVKSLCVAKSLLHSFSKLSEAHQETWETEVKRNGNIGVIGRDLEKQFTDWEKFVCQESAELSVFIKKHNNILGERSTNLEQQNDWLGGFLEKMDKLI